ncbi:MAG: polysaccharide deacetylase family protein [Clostridia bacterium]|nr:polysaccharide deacetylase family protein [Clostridia bacterium]
MRIMISGWRGILTVVGIVVLAAMLVAVCCVHVACSGGQGVAVPILMYHSVGYNPRVQSQYILSPEVFEEDMRWLSEHGYTAVFVSDLVNYVSRKTALPDKPVVITLDDGFLNNRTYALPILQRYGMRGVVSVVGSFSEEYSRNPDPDPSYAYLTWEDISFLAESGSIEIGNHTYEMHSMGKRTGCMRLAEESVAAYSAALSNDLSKLQSMLTEKAGVTPSVFAYPYGAVSQEAVFVLQSLGFSAALTCTEKINFISPTAPERLYHLGRFNRPAGEPTEDFMNRVMGGT